MIRSITRAYTRHYTDNGQTTAYVEFISDENRPGRIEGRRASLHMRELFNRARRDGVKIEHETW